MPLMPASKEQQDVSKGAAAETAEMLQALDSWLARVDEVLKFSFT